MATPSEVQTLISDARCYACIPSGLQWYVVLAALIDVRDGNPVPTDTNELIAEAVCLQCIPLGMIPAVLVNVARGISGGALGSQEVYSGVWDDPNGNVTPTDQTKGARYAQLASAGGTGVEWHWQTDTLIWV